MTAKRINNETFGEAPLEKRGRSADIRESDFDAELDDEVEKELREFEQLQTGLLETPVEQQNSKTRVENKRHTVKESEQENASGSDMELDDLEQEIAQARMNSTELQHETVEEVPNKRHPAMEETVPPRGIRILPETFAEENLRGDDLVEKSGIPEDGEEACLDIERLRPFKGSRAARDPLLTPDPTPRFNDPNFMAQNRVKSHCQSSRLEQSEVEQSQVQLTDHAYQKPLSPEPNSDNDSNDPDFPSPGKRKSRSRARIRRSKSSRPELRKSSKHKVDQDSLTSKLPETVHEHDFHGPTSQVYAKSSETFMSPMTRTQPSSPSRRSSRSPLTKDTIQDVSQRHLQTTGTNQIETPFQAAQFVPKEVFVDPVLKSQPKSFDQDPKFRDLPLSQQTERPKLGDGQKHERPIRVEQSGDNKMPEKPQTLGHHVRAIDFNQNGTGPNPTVQHNLPIQMNKYPPEVAESIPRAKSPLKISPEQEELQSAPSPHHNNPKPPKHPAYLEFLQNSKNLANPAPHSEEQYWKEQAPIPQSSDDTQPTTATHERPAEYCVIEQIMHRRFRNSFTLESEKLDMMKADRPTIQCPELYPYVKYYESQTWLVACNELKRFFCWPCLLFASKIIWPVTCDEISETMFGKEINKHAQTPVHQECVKQFDAFMLKSKSSIIKKLLNDNFVDGTWTDKDREAIILKGRPQPIWDGMSDKSKKEEMVALETFYDRFKWICGCTNSKKFYCWPCLLFSREKWCCAGTVKSAEAMASQHETKKLHMAACLKLGKQEFDLKKKPEANKEEIEKTRSFVTSLVEILCAEKKKINNTEFSSMDFVDTLELMSEYNGKLRIFIDGKSKNSKIAAARVFTVAILDSVEFFIKHGILDEIKNSNFISLIFDHSSGSSNKAILSVIARYVDINGQVHERFIKLLNVGYNTPSNILSDEFFQIITELQCRSTLVGFTYDGYLVKPGNIPEFNKKVQKLCPNSKFFHYAQHNFKRVLKQTLCHVPICRRVLQAVKELASFFESTPAARKGLLDIIAAAEKSNCGDVWRSNFIMTVFIYHAVIVEIMESICKNAHNWKIKTVVQATNFLDFLKDSTNRFFVTLMARMFSAVEDLSKELDQAVGIEDLKTVASHTALKIQKLGRNFDSVVESACSHLEASNQESTRKEMSTLRDQFSNVVRLVVKLVKNRIFGMEAGYFKISKEAPTPSFANFIKLNRQNLVLQNVNLPMNFNSAKLSNELQFFHEASVSSGHSLSDIIAQMINYNMVQVLPELFKFLQLALTIPQKHYDVSTIPAVRRISAYVDGKKELNSTDALIWMEKEFLSNLQKEPEFYPKVTDRVMSLTKKEIFEQLSKKN